MKYIEKYARDLVVGDVVPNRGVVASELDLWVDGENVEVEFSSTFKYEKTGNLKLKGTEVVLVKEEG